MYSLTFVNQNADSNWSNKEYSYLILSPAMVIHFGGLLFPGGLLFIAFTILVSLQE